jgi:putative ABC transport system permease protein
MLAMLSIMVGVSSVLVIDAVGRAQQAAVLAQLAILGTNLVTITPGDGHASNAGASSPVALTADDAAHLRTGVAHLTALSPEVANTYTAEVGRYVTTVLVTGALPEDQRIHNDALSSGAFFTTQDEERGALVAVVGPTVVRKLFPAGDPVGKLVDIQRVSFRVVGMLKAKGSQGQLDLDNIVIVPLHTAQQRLSGYGSYSSIDLQVDTVAHIPAVETAVTVTLTAAHPRPAGQARGFTVQSDEQAVNAASQQASVLTAVLRLAAAVALVVGGFAVMNIMLLSVTERTPEIGVRIAVGARPADIVVQWVVEAALFTSVGGVLGASAGIAAGGIITHVASSLSGHPAWPSPLTVLLAVAVPASIGAVFGIYPAYRAAQLDPIRALRYE